MKSNRVPLLRGRGSEERRPRRTRRFRRRRRGGASRHSTSCRLSSRPTSASHRAISVGCSGARGCTARILSAWRKAAREGSLRELARKRGPKPSAGKRDVKRLRRLERENARLREELRKARIVIEVQGKVSGLLGLSLGDGKSS